MAINDNDKKFIKDTIDNALFNYEKKSDDKLKKYEENRKKLSKQEREDYIAILQKKNEQGEATLAQKFEMLKLSVENAVPEDLKDAFSSGKKAVKGGLNQVNPNIEDSDSIDFIIDKTSNMGFNKFIQYVYSTYPILSSQHGETLNLITKAEEYRTNKQD